MRHSSSPKDRGRIHRNLMNLYNKYMIYIYTHTVTFQKMYTSYTYNALVVWFFSEHQIWVPGLECKNHTTSNLQGFQGKNKVGYTRKLRQFAKAPANFALLGRPAGHSSAINSNCHVIFGLSACCHAHVASSFAGIGLNFSSWAVAPSLRSTWPW